MVCTSFAGLFIFIIPGTGQALSPSYEANGDIFIGEDFENDTWLIGGTANINGDLTIRAGGTVMVTNGVMNFRSTTDGLNKLVIEDGGQLILINSVLKTEKALYNINDALGVLVRNNGTISAENSQLLFNGKILVDNANFVAVGTQIRGPLFTAMSSQVELYDSELNEVPGMPILQEETYPYSFAASSNYTLNVNYLFERNPDSVSTGQNVADLEMNDSKNVSLAETQVVTVDGFDIGGLIFDEGEAVLMELNAEYKTADDFNDSGSPNTFQYAEYLSGFVSAPNMLVEATYEAHAPAATNQEKVITQDLTSLDLSSADLSKLSVRLTNTKAYNVYIDRIWVEVKLAIPAYHNITVAGTSEFTAVNSLLGANYQNYSVPSYSKLVAAGASQVNLYGVTVNQDGYGTDVEFDLNGTGPFVTLGNKITFKPSTIGGADTTGETNVFGLLYDDGYAAPASIYGVDGGETMNIGGFQTADLYGAISDPVLTVYWMTDILFTSQSIMYNVIGQPEVYSGITITQEESTQSSDSSALSYYPPTSISEVSELNIIFTNNNAIGTNAHIGYIELNATVNPEINIYRWAEVGVFDRSNIPVSGAYVNATVSSTGLPASYYYDNGVSQTPPGLVLSYLERNAVNYKLTNEYGLVTIPLLTDYINYFWAPNSYAMDDYSIQVDYMNASAIHFTPSPQYTGFDYYPNLTNQSIEMEFVLAINLADPGEDWLVNSVWPSIVGTNLMITGNIIVEGSGRLSLTNTQLLMSQASKPTQIVVRDSGTLMLDQSTVSSDATLGIYLYDNARLYLNSSTLGTYVETVLDGSSDVYMDESIVFGDIQAPTSSAATLVAINTTFGRTWSYFGGSSVAELTGATVLGTPALSPKDSAVVTLYSWIVASVYDGTGEHKIPGANVGVHYFFNPLLLYMTGETNASGVWQFRALSDVITVAGSSIGTGSYLLNATYWYDGQRYDVDSNKSAQVLYSPDTPLVRNDAMVRLDIPDALPDIDPPFNVSNNEPARGGQITLSTVVNNIGVVTAYDVLVRFEDNSSAGKFIIEDVVVEELAPLSNINVSIVWTASYPLGAHNLSVTIDPLNEIPELNESNNQNSTTVNVLGVPDLVITISDITVSPQSPERDKEASISVNVRNIGDNATSAFNVSFYDGLTLIGIAQISNLPTGEAGVASISWTPTVPGQRILVVVVDEADVILESNEVNNRAELAVHVGNYPDLVASSVSFTVDGAIVSKAFVNKQVTITAKVINTGESSAEDFDIVFWLNGEEIINIVRVSALAPGATINVNTVWVATTIIGMGLYQNHTMTAVVNPASNSTITHIAEIDDPTNGNNQASQVIMVTDNRPNLAIYNATVRSVGVDITSATIGEAVHVIFDVRNVGIVGATNARVNVTLINATTSILIYSEARNLGIGETVAFDVVWAVNVTSNDYSIVIDVDPGADSDLTDNTADLDLAVLVPDPVIIINLGGKVEYAPGTSIYVQGTVKRSANNAPLVDQVVKVKITDSDGFALTEEISTITNANGEFASYIPIPTGKEGEQVVMVTLVTIEGEFSETSDININAPFTPETIPSWVYLLIIAIVIAVIVIFSMYLYRVGLGRMVECGNCGALIPEASKHCPKCGVGFEANTAKCSECGAWIPSKAESCPDCGAKFMTEPLEIGQAPGYIEAMRKQYDEYNDGFRDQAKAALGNKYSEEKFMEWLQTEPNYLPFEEWLRKEEMGRKSGVFPCPDCGTLNPRDSKICNRCGTVFEQGIAMEEAPKVEEKKSPFRRIVRRSSEPKKQPKEEPAEQTIEQITEQPPAEEGKDKTE